MSESSSLYTDIIQDYQLSLKDGNWISGNKSLINYFNILYDIFLIHPISFKDASNSYQVCCMNSECNFNLNYDPFSGLKLNFQHNHDEFINSEEEVLLKRLSLEVIRMGTNDFEFTKICNKYLETNYTNSRDLIKKILNECTIFQSNIHRLNTRFDKIKDFCERYEDTYFKFFEEIVSEDLYILPIQNTCMTTKNFYQTLIIYQVLDKPRICGFIIINNTNQIKSILESQNLLKKKFILELNPELINLFNNNELNFNISKEFIKSLLKKLDLSYENLNDIKEDSLPDKYKFLHHIINDYSLKDVFHPQIIASIRVFLYSSRNDIITNVKKIKDLYDHQDNIEGSNLSESSFVELLSQFDLISEIQQEKFRLLNEKQKVFKICKNIMLKCEKSGSNQLIHDFLMILEPFQYILGQEEEEYV
ncbi:uncharacterized protein KGF55_000021 [Candida pseudojiufengensis]|uniref:uncharacterized protein n=1 Tax=Candida pseudojiufengensis TaxID=497109 RepID=UPI00222526BA|nr:uncharacterized protein KGF55_000021 [Candida pseudojiufengensis]KAI5968151.1 hypothetical protein KGF55_000021 [Candida pseudojiufengensis]